MTERSVKDNYFFKIEKYFLIKFNTCDFDERVY